MERFKELNALSFEELLNLRDEVRDELADKVSAKYRLIAQIMFYESQLADTTQQEAK